MLTSTITFSVRSQHHDHNISLITYIFILLQFIHLSFIITSSDASLHVQIYESIIMAPLRRSIRDRNPKAKIVSSPKSSKVTKPKSSKATKPKSTKVIKPKSTKVNKPKARDATGGKVPRKPLAAKAARKQVTTSAVPPPKKRYRYKPGSM